MKETNFQELVTKHTKDGVIDYKSIVEVINKEANDLLAANKPDKDKLIADYKSDWIASLGFEGVSDETQLKAYVKGTANEWKEKYNNLNTETSTKIKELTEKVNTYSADSTELQSYKNKDLLRSKGIVDSDMMEFYEYKINKLDGESFTDKLEAFTKDNPEVFKAQAPKNTTGIRVGVTTGTDKPKWEQQLEEKYPDLLGEK